MLQEHGKPVKKLFVDLVRRCSDESIDLSQHEFISIAIDVPIIYFNELETSLGKLCLQC